MANGGKRTPAKDGGYFVDESDGYTYHYDANGVKTGRVKTTRSANAVHASASGNVSNTDRKRDNIIIKKTNPKGGVRAVTDPIVARQLREKREKERERQRYLDEETSKRLTTYTDETQLTKQDREYMKKHDLVWDSEYRGVRHNFGADVDAYSKPSGAAKPEPEPEPEEKQPKQKKAYNISGDYHMASYPMSTAYGDQYKKGDEVVRLGHSMFVKNPETGEIEFAKEGFQRGRNVRYHSPKKAVYTVPGTMGTAVDTIRTENISGLKELFDKRDTDEWKKKNEVAGDKRYGPGFVAGIDAQGEADRYVTEDELKHNKIGVGLQNPTVFTETNPKAFGGALRSVRNLRKRR